MEGTINIERFAFASSLAVHLFAVVLVSSGQNDKYDTLLLAALSLSAVILVLGRLVSYRKRNAPIKINHNNQVNHNNVSNSRELHQAVFSIKKFVYDIDHRLDTLVAKRLDEKGDIKPQQMEQLEEESKAAFAAVVNGYDLVRRVSNRLQKLLYQSRESSNFAAANRLDWRKNTMIGQLSQVRVSQDKINNTSKKIAAIHDSTLRLIDEGLKTDQIFRDKIDRVKAYLEEVQDGAHLGYNSHDSLIALIGDCLEGIATASRYVNGITQKSDTLNAEMNRLYGLSEKINTVSCTMSLKLSKSLLDTDVQQLANSLRVSCASFQTSSRSILDIGSDIQDEVEKAIHKLSESSKQAQKAFASMTDCGELYRNNVSATKFGISELGLLTKEVQIHVKRLGEAKELGSNTETLIQNLNQLLSAYGGINQKIASDTNELTAHCDRLSQLLAKQYYELSHCEKMTSDGSDLIKVTVEYVTQYEQTMTGLKNEPGDDLEGKRRRELETWRHRLTDEKRQVQIIEKALETGFKEEENLTLVPIEKSIFPQAY